MTLTLETLCGSQPQAQALLADPCLRKELKFWAHEHHQGREFVLAFSEGQVLGVASLKSHSSRVPGALGLCFVSVRPQFRKRAVGSCLVRKVFEIAAQRKQDIANTSYVGEGGKTLKRLLESEAQRWPSVALREKA